MEITNLAEKIMEIANFIIMENDNFKQFQIME